jgi:hypothetical protein
MTSYRDAERLRSGEYITCMSTYAYACTYTSVRSVQVRHAWSAGILPSSNWRTRLASVIGV